MRSETVIGFYDEMEKIAAGLSADQMRRIGEKGAKRGWTAARESKSIKRLLNRDMRHAPLEATHVRGSHTRVDRGPRAAAVPKIPVKKFGRKTTGVLGVGAGAAGAGEAGHLRHGKDEEQVKAAADLGSPHSAPPMAKAPPPAPAHNWKPIAPSQVNTSGMSLSMRRAVENMHH